MKLVQSPEFNTLKTSVGALQLLLPTDCVKDRLASFFYWNDAQSLDQALMVAEDHPIDIDDLKRWAKGEGFESKIKIFLRKVKE